MLDKINLIRQKISEELGQTTTKDLIVRLEADFSRKIKELFEEMKTVPNEQKRQLGQLINELKQLATQKIAELKAKIVSVDSEKLLDLSISSGFFEEGKVHPLNRVLKMLQDVYKNMGFSVVYGPEIENDLYNYEMLNMPYYHPARDMQDTFYLEYPNTLLRSHTSCVQIRYMLENKPPFMIISPGLVYRVDEIDPQHTPCFYQIEGLAVGEGISLANLKWTLIESIKEVFGADYKVRFSPCYYPYTEPSAAIDMSCIMCAGKGCRTCKGMGWMRVGGAGMVHPNVFKNVGYPEGMTGFAFGWGLNRFPMLYYQIAEMRKLFENSVTLWRQL